MVVDPLIGATLRAGLRLDAVIAQGSFGVVFRARQLAVERDVAVKVLHAGLAPETEAGRLFRDEIRAIGRLDHRNVVRIFDADETPDGRLYFVMELLDGPTLQQLADAGPVPPARAIALVGQLLDGLAAVHEAGHIHADVKPSNAVVCGAGAAMRVVLIDFGLSRLRRAGRPAEAVGGTLAYMAPEQLHTWEVDARSDVFSAALVLVRLVTGWQRTDAHAVPPLDAVADPALRRALERGLAEDPAARPSAIDFARALRGGAPDEPHEPGPPPPFRELAPLTERDRGRLQGREADVLRLARRIDARRAVVLTAPSGTGKTSLLRAGLIPYLDAAGVAHVYLACQLRSAPALAGLLDPGANEIREAVAACRARGQRPVVILDQLEAALAGGGDGAALLDALLGAAPAAELAVVLAVREDFVARLLAATPALEDGAPQVRLLPLDREGARAALVAPLAEHGVALAPALLDQLLGDLVRAGREFGRDAGADGEPAIYPPHVQLAGGALFDALDAGERTLELAHYRRLGGFDAIVGEHLERTLGELSAADRDIARDVFLALAASAPTRALRGEVELVDAVGARHGDVGVHRVLARLEARRLIARTTGPDGTPSWILVHDTLVPRIEAWLTLQDLDRRRAAEAVRFHLRQSRPDAPATFSGRQLGVFERFPGLIDELETEWARRSAAVWTPRRLIRRSRQVLRYRRGLIAGATAAVIALTAVLLIRWLDERRLLERERRLSELDLGRFDLTIELFDWRLDPQSHAVARTAVDPAELPALDWSLHDPDADDPDAPGPRITAPRFRSGVRQRRGGTFVEADIEARGGAAFLRVSGRGRDGDDCPASVIPVRRLPGHDRYEAPSHIRVLVPTCRATRFETVLVPAGPFVAGGPGDPPSQLAAADLAPERVVELPAFAIDRTEVTNAAFATFTEMAEVHEIVASEYIEVLAVASGPTYPRADIDWFDARAYCRFLGKDLPTSLQWQKALRGGLDLPEGPNPAPRRNLPWIASPRPAWQLARIAAEDQLPDAGAQFGAVADRRRPSPVGSYPDDRSPYGILDLAGNLQEWTLDPEPDTESKHLSMLLQNRITRGGNWFDTQAATLADYMAAQNNRSPRWRQPTGGVRCVLQVPSAGPAATPTGGS